MPDLVAAIDRCCSQQGFGPERVAQVKSSLILKPTPRRSSDFAGVASSVVGSFLLPGFVRRVMVGCAMLLGFAQAAGRGVDLGRHTGT